MSQVVGEGEENHLSRGHRVSIGSITECRINFSAISNPIVPFARRSHFVTASITLLTSLQSSISMAVLLPSMDVGFVIFGASV